jgi:hypothetical protein
LKTIQVSDFISKFSFQRPNLFEGIKIFRWQNLKINILHQGNWWTERLWDSHLFEKHFIFEQEMIIWNVFITKRASHMQWYCSMHEAVLSTLKMRNILGIGIGSKFQNNLRYQYIARDQIFYLVSRGRPWNQKNVWIKSLGIFGASKACKNLRISRSFWKIKTGDNSFCIKNSWSRKRIEIFFFDKDSPLKAISKLWS